MTYSFSRCINTLDSVMKKITYNIEEKENLTLMRDSGGRIVAMQPSCTIGSDIATLGQKVFSKGVHEVPVRTMGIIVELHEPFSAGHTSDVIGVWYEGNHRALRMQFGELTGMPIGKITADGIRSIS